MRDKFDNKIESKYMRLGITLFFSGAALIVFYGIVSNLPKAYDVVSTIVGIFSPFIYGLVMAYLMCPVYNVVVRKSYRALKPKISRPTRALRISRVLGTIVSLFVLIGVVGGLLWLVIPELIKSIVGLVQIVPDKLDLLNDWIDNHTGAGASRTGISDNAVEIISTLREKFSDWGQNTVLPSLGTYVTKVTEGIIVTLRTLLDILVGLIVCVYFLNRKELFRAQTKKMIRAMCSRDRADKFMEFASFCDRTFGGFINGKIIDSIIIGILCYIIMLITGMPYPVLISTIIGITNIIPFFGPFIGAIPSILIIFIVSPINALYFAIMVLCLQQFDGCILGPKILGDKVGMESFWVMFSIIISGGLFGFIGMVLGVPTFAVIYYYISKGISKKLKSKAMPVATADYEDFDAYGIDRKEILK